MIIPTTPSSVALIALSMTGFACFFRSLGTGSQRISCAALLIENLNTWSENFAINTDARIGIIRKPDVPKASEIGKNRSPASIPKRAKTTPVIKNCIKIVAAPVAI